MACTKPPNIIWDVAVTTTAANSNIFHHQNDDHHPPHVSLPLPTTSTTHPRIRVTLYIRPRYHTTTFATSNTYDESTAVDSRHANRLANRQDQARGGTQHTTISERGGTEYGSSTPKYGVGSRRRHDAGILVPSRVIAFRCHTTIKKEECHTTIKKEEEEEGGKEEDVKECGTK